MSHKSSIVFQICNITAFDHEFEEEDESESNTSSKKYLIKLFGVTQEGLSVCVNVLDFTPFFFIKLDPKLCSINRQTSTVLYDFLSRKLPYSLRSSILDVHLLKKKDFYGFQNNETHYFARFKFKSLAGYKQSIRIFSQKVNILSFSKHDIKFALYESNIEPFLRMIHIRGIDPCGWITTEYNSTDESEIILPTHCKVNINCHWTSLNRINIEKIAPLTIASFDIECSSSHGDFPVAKKNYKKTAYELYQYFISKKDTENIKDHIKNELVQIFNHESKEGVFSKVFIKKTSKLYLFHDIVEKNIDDIFTILLGRLVYKDAKNTPSNDRERIMHQLIIKLGDYQQGRWVGIFPPIEGDNIIQIGTTIHRYGETSCFYKSIITLGTCDPIEGVDVQECETEEEVLKKWKELIINTDPDVITGYNIFGFDMSYIWDRANELNILYEISTIGRIVDKPCQYLEKQLSSSALGDNLLKYIDMDGRVMIDVMKVVQRDHKLDSYKLDTVANHFLKMNKHDIHPTDIFRLQKGDSKDRSIIADYCVQDCALCNHLIMKLEILANNIGMANVCTVPLSYIFMRGQGIKIFSLVAKECRSDNFLIPTLSKYLYGGTSDEIIEDEEGYEGAIVLDPKEGIYIEDPINVLDYASLYPSSMISENLSHDKIVLDPKYNNLPGIKYNDITYDVYEKINDKKVKTSETTVRYVENEVGAIPKILMKLLKNRKETRKKMEFKNVQDMNGDIFTGIVNILEDGKVEVCDLHGVKTIVETPINITNTYDEFQKAVLDGLQLAYKVTANSLYGQCGAKTSPIYLKEIAACTTATGRKMILKAKEFLETNYNAQIVYGDTDSLFVIFPNKDQQGNPIHGKQAINVSIETAMNASKEFRKNLKPPHDLEYEKTFWPFILLSKKRYCANKYEFDDHKCKMNSMGIVLKRRDNAHIVKDIYGGVLDIILNEQNITKSIDFLKTSLQSLIDGKVDIDKLVITKSLRSEYKTPDKIAHKVLAERMGERDPGNKPQVNDRIPFVYIQVDDSKKNILQGDRIEHPDFIKANNLKPDYEFYITNQIMKPILQLYALELNAISNGKKCLPDDIFNKLLKEKEGDIKKAKEKLNDLKENEVKKILFDPFLIKLSNKRKGNHMITDFFKIH